MDAHPTPARLNVMLQGRLLRRVGQHVPGRVQKDYDLVLRQVRVVEPRRILGRIYRKIVRRRELLDSLNPIRDRSMAKPRRCGKDERLESCRAHWPGETQRQKYRPRPGP